MCPNIIDTLRGVEPEMRVEIMEDVYRRNIEFFKKRYPLLNSIINNVKCPYGINMTDTFLEIYDERTGKIVHPQGGLDSFSEMLGDWTHNAWVDLTNFHVVAPSKYPLHHDPLKNFNREMMCAFPEYPIRFGQKKINLKEVGENKRFSPPTVFLGIFHGLHIAYYMSRTEMTNVLFLEPDVTKFEVSCYFLDYEKINSQVDFSMFVGDDLTSEPISYFFGIRNVSRQAWIRILPGYVHEKNPHYIEILRSNQRSVSNIFFPIDYEIAGLKHSSNNLQRKLPLLTKKPKLSKKSRICIVATGPSLENDLKWLKKNQDKLVIFAIQSSVRILKTAGIRPDFQFSLETIIDEEDLELLEMDEDIPIVLFHKAPDVLVDKFKTVLLCGVADHGSHVKFSVNLKDVSPSTLNLALAFACHCSPKEIIIVGADLSKPISGDFHAKGSFIYDRTDGQDSGYEEMSKILVESSLNKGVLLESNPFFRQTLVSLERKIREQKNKIAFVNLSDGAKIKETRAVRSSNYSLKGKYDQKSSDVNAILESFITADENVNWRSYEKSGELFLEELKESIIENISLEKFTWKSFILLIDKIFIVAEEKARVSKDDLRADVFGRYICDMLNMWYIAVILFDDVEKAEAIYRFGAKKIVEKIDELEWPVNE